MLPTIPLKAAIRARLAADSALTALLGGAKIHDETPRGEATPYVVFSDAVCRDNGTVSDQGHISEMTLSVWSRQGGTREAADAADRIAALLHDTALTVSGHRVINCRVTAAETQRDAGRELTRSLVRLRIVTEML